MPILLTRRLLKLNPNILITIYGSCHKWAMSSLVKQKDFYLYCSQQGWSFHYQNPHLIKYLLIFNMH